MAFMEIYLVIVIILFVLAASDLVVGVANDAVNFLNSAIGSKVAPRHIIMIVASAGIFTGTLFSSGLMEVARKGIFNPDQFIFPEVMVIFLAVMLTDVLLLDLFNTYGLPTSTTVSLIFGLLGSAVAVSIFKIINQGEGLGELVRYINTAKALAIITGILSSVVIAFTAGAVIQYFTRLVFTFDYEKRIRRYGSIWGSLALTAITFFILFKGAKGSSIISPENAEWIKNNTGMVFLYSFIFWAVLLQLMLWFTKINILKPIVLMGTFGLALAFAANDLVNFIGVPLAGFASFQLASESPDFMNFNMVGLLDPVITSSYFLVISGIIMVTTLWFSSKARSVTKTEVNLGRQSDGYERFESSILSRRLVGLSRSMGDVTKKVLSEKLITKMNDRFEQIKPIEKDKKDRPAFDLLRAAVNLMVASALISLATSLKLPLSTTYVTFMVAMGSSLSDRAWGRESAVYRINGVLTVIAGWFITALMAFTSAAIFATGIYYGGIVVSLLFVLMAGFIIFKTHVFHSKKVKDEEEIENRYFTEVNEKRDIVTTFMKDSVVVLNSITNIIPEVLKGLLEDNRLKLKDQKKEIKKMIKNSNKLVSNLFQSIQILEIKDIRKGSRFGKLIASVEGVGNNFRSLHDKIFEHIDNNHHIPQDNQAADLIKISDLLTAQVNTVSGIFEKTDFSNFSDVKLQSDNLREFLREADENQIVRIKSEESSPRTSLLFLGILTDVEKISDHINDMVDICYRTYENISKKQKEPKVQDTAVKDTKTGD